MADILEIMKRRRSVRRYSGEKVSGEALEKILEAGLLAPSGKGIYPWEFITIRDRQMLDRLSRCREGAARMLEGADCAVAVIADTQKSDVWIEDCAAAMMSMHLAASALGVGSCWIQGRLRRAEDGRSTDEYVRELLSYPEEFSLLAVLSLGIPQKEPRMRCKAELKWEKIHEERF